MNASFNDEHFLIKFFKINLFSMLKSSNKARVLMLSFKLLDD